MLGKNRRLCANALRALAMDAVQSADSGHPGMPMGMADIAEALWRHHLRHNPENPGWPDRDRFILSNGHGSMLIYALLHLTGYDLALDELKRFRRWGSKTPGHPERGLTPGVETTTGPLGQGFANAVGMALAERLLAARFNRPGHEIVNHLTYVFLGDGCLMEGISHEAASLAGTWGLGKLVAFYDDNGISIDGKVSGWFTDDTAARFRAYGWHVIDSVDGHRAESIDKAIAEAKAERSQPTLVCCRTVIGYGAPHKAGTHEAHGAALGAEEVAAARRELGWDAPPFEIPQPIRNAWDARTAGAAAEEDWNRRFAAYAEAYPDLANEFRRRMAGELPRQWPKIRDKLLADARAAHGKTATRKASQNCLAKLVEDLPELLGGSADLAPSNLTIVPASHPVRPGAVAGGNYLHFGVREFGMVAIMNGMALHGGHLPYGGTFLIFSDYARNAIRMAALMGVRTVFVLTHDSIGLGEDGPTHQPVEQAPSLRLMPNLAVWRPADELETAYAWRAALENTSGPTALLLSRQGLPALPRAPAGDELIARGGYVLAEPDKGRHPDLVLIATGSEVQLALQAKTLLEVDNLAARVVSMPSTTVFDSQSTEYRTHVLPDGVPRLAVEASHPDGWWKYVGLDGAVIGLPHYGESAPADELFKHFGITAERVRERARDMLINRLNSPRNANAQEAQREE